MMHLTISRLVHDRRRLLLTVTSVAIGVAFLTAALVMSGSSRHALEASYAQVYAGVDVIVRGPEAPGESVLGEDGAPVDEDTLAAVLDVRGVDSADGRLRAAALLSDADADADSHTAIAMAVPADPVRASVDVRTGRLPEQAAEIAIDAALARQSGLGLGDHVEVLLPSGLHRAEVVGTVGFGPLDGLAGGGRLLVDAATAAARFGADGYAEIAVSATSGVTATELAARLGDELGADVRVVTADVAAARDAVEAAKQTAPLRWIVVAVAIVALLVGGFVIANTFRVLVAQRARELALLRGVGATRRQVARSVRLEAAITGAAGAVVGVVAGLGVGVALVAASSGLLPGLPPTAATITLPALLAGPAVGVVLALLAVHGAVRRTGTLPPVAALRAVALEDAIPSKTRLIAGVAVLAAGVGGTLIGLAGSAGPMIVGGVTATVVGVGLLFPVLTGPVLSLLSWPVGRAGQIGALARGQALASPRRIGTTAASLAVTVALVTLLLAFNASLGASVPAALEARQHAEYAVTSTAPPGLQGGVAEVAEQALRIPGVATAAVVTYVDVRVADSVGDDPRPRGGAAHVVDPTRVAAVLDVEATDGHLDDLAAGGIAVRDGIAAERGWERGDRLVVELPDGTRSEVAVMALFDGGITTDWLLAPATVEGHVPAPYQDAFVRLANGADTAVVEQQLAALVADVPATDLASRDEQAAQMSDENQGTLGILTALFGLSLVVGGLGIANTLTLVVHERLRELGMLRAIGATRRQVRMLVRWEAVLTTSLGAAVGTVLGLAGAWVAVRAMPGSGQAFTAPPVHLVLVVVGTVLIGLVSSAVPARRAARVDVLRAVAST